MKTTLRTLAAVLILASLAFAGPNNRDHNLDGWGKWGRKPHQSVPEPGSMVMLTLTAGTLVGGLFARRRMHSRAV